MDDKSVGELWNRLITRCVVYQREHHAELRSLIRKLVEERARVLYAEYNLSQQDVNEERWDALHEFNRAPWFHDALHEFGIDPETWK